MLKALKLPRGWLPDTLESSEIAGQISRGAAQATGLLEGTPVVAGGGDQAAGAVGCGIVQPGVVSASMGTSGVIFAASGRPERVPDGRLHLFCSAVKGGWHLMGVTLSAGGALRWLRDELGGAVVPHTKSRTADPYDLMCREAARVPAGAEGLVFLPYLTGERTPHADPLARGVFFGLSLRHGARHMTRAVLEGVAYGLRDSLELITELGVPVSRVRLSGGGARNRLWCQIQTDVYGKTGARLTREEGPAMGAAILAGIGLGVFRDYGQAMRICVSEKDCFRPSQALEQVYDRGYRLYRKLYPALRPLFPLNVDKPD